MAEDFGFEFEEQFQKSEIRQYVCSTWQDWNNQLWSLQAVYNTAI